MAGLFCFSTKAEQDALAAEIRQHGIRRREFERITVFEDCLSFEFKSGLETEVQK